MTFPHLIVFALTLCIFPAAALAEGIVLLFAEDPCGDPLLAAPTSLGRPQAQTASVSRAG